jgi:CDP-4-dehydro-6-deoxyglucose reductase
MTTTITIKPSDKQYQADPGETVLAAALRNGLGLPYSCRGGSCGTCKGKVLEGSVDYGTFQQQWLTDAEKAEGWALFCCAKPLTDLVIECDKVRELGDVPIRIVPSRVQKMEKVTDDVMIINLKLPASEHLQFLAGQYLDIMLKGGERRSFSMGNAPHDSETVQLHIRHVPGGSFTEHVFTKMKERDILRIELPLGSFYLREDSDKPIVFVASGTGFAPIKSIIEHAFMKGITRKMVLYWGARRPKDIYMDALAKQWAADHANFSYVPVMSESTADDSWTGRTGFVHRAVMADVPDLSGHQVYACGVPIMVDSARRDLTEQCGLPDEEFFADSFTTAADTAKAG